MSDKKNAQSIYLYFDVLYLSSPWGSKLLEYKNIEIVLIGADGFERFGNKIRPAGKII